MIARVALALWFLSAAFCTLSGAFVVRHEDVPWLLLAHLFGAPLAFVAAYNLSASLRGFVLSLDPRFLTSIHGVRFVGIGFVALGHASVLAPLFANTAGWGDVLVAVPAPFLGFFVKSRRALLAFQLFGMLDFVAAVSTNLLTSATALGVIRGDGPDSSLMATYPLAIIPSFGVPVLFLAHLASIAVLRRPQGGS